MENQVKQLKINVTNIKSYLINSNKQLKSLKVQKSNLFSKIEKQKEVSDKEQRLETKNLGIGSGFSRLASVVTAPARNIFDRILEFVGLVALGILVQNLPQIIEQINSFLNSDFIKAVGTVFKILGDGFTSLGQLLGIIPKQKQNEIDKELRDIERLIDQDSQNASQADKEALSLEKQVQEVSKVKTTKETTSVQTSQPADRPVPVTPGSVSQSDPSKLSAPAQFSKGGTVSSGNVQNNRQKSSGSGKFKQSKRSMDDGFIGFSEAVNKIAVNAETDRKNVLAFAKMSDHFKEYVGVSTSGLGTRLRGPGDPGPPGSGRRGDRQYGDKSFSSGAYIGATGDTDGQQTGLNMNLAGGIGTPIYAPFDFIYKTRGTDGMASVGLQGTSGVLGPSGSGFGYYGAYFFQKDGKEYEVLMGHFKSLPYKGKKDGEIIPKGTLLGYQGASGRSVSGTGGVYPHISLHVNGVGFRASNSLLVDVANQLLKAGPAAKPKPTPAKDPMLLLQNGEGGGSRLNSRSSNGNQTVVVYAVQPVETYIPYPVPYPVKTASKSSASTPRLPAIWRT